MLINYLWAINNETGRKQKKMQKNSQEEVIEIRNLIKKFYLMINFCVKIMSIFDEWILG